MRYIEMLVINIEQVMALLDLDKQIVLTLVAIAMFFSFVLYVFWSIIGKGSSEYIGLDEDEENEDYIEYGINKDNKNEGKKNDGEESK